METHFNSIYNCQVSWNLVKMEVFVSILLLIIYELNQVKRKHLMLDGAFILWWNMSLKWAYRRYFKMVCLKTVLLTSSFWSGWSRNSTDHKKIKLNFLFKIRCVLSWMCYDQNSKYHSVYIVWLKRQVSQQQQSFAALKIIRFIWYRPSHKPQHSSMQVRRREAVDDRMRQTERGSISLNDNPSSIIFFLAKWGN